VSVATSGRRYLSAMVGLLLIVCAALVIAGVSIERGGESHTPSGETAEHVEAGHEEQPEAHQPQAPSESAESGVVRTLESPVALAALAVVSVGLAALIWWRPTRPVAVTVAVVAVIAGVFDLIELIRHLSADRGGLAALAGLILALRVVTVAGAAMLLRRAGRNTSAATG
jgi:hypothetical protein